MRRVVLGQVCVGFGIAKIIDRDDLDVVLFAALVMRTQNVAADAAIAVNCNANRHDVFS